MPSTPAEPRRWPIGANHSILIGRLHRAKKAMNGSTLNAQSALSAANGAAAHAPGNRNGASAQPHAQSALPQPHSGRLQPLTLPLCAACRVASAGGDMAAPVLNDWLRRTLDIRNPAAQTADNAWERAGAGSPDETTGLARDAKPEKTTALTSKDTGQPHPALSAALAQGLIVQSGDQVALTDAGKAATAYLARVDSAKTTGGRFSAGGKPSAATDDAVAERHLAAIALGLDATDKAVIRNLGRRENLETAALFVLFGFPLPGKEPSRAAFRHALTRAVLEHRVPEFGAAFTAAPAKNYRTNSLVNALIIGLAGGRHTTIEEAETHMLHNALGIKHGDRIALATALIRAASRPKAAEAPRTINVAKTDSVAEFAAAVRRLAKTMETQPYKGRVAIAQVYDAAAATGAYAGTLEEFKARIAEACRAGEIDLERYDIAGPLDTSLRDRSRTPFGRDERHFIVNQWI